MSIFFLQAFFGRFDHAKTKNIFRLSVIMLQNMRPHLQGERTVFTSHQISLPSTHLVASFFMADWFSYVKHTPVQWENNKHEITEGSRSS